MKIEPVTLVGKTVELVPLEPGHYEGLLKAAMATDVWKWTANVVNSEDDFKRYFDAAVADRDRGVSVPFVTRVRESGEVVGSTRFGNIDTTHRRAEIGWTWITPKWQRTSVNTEAKLLMLTHAFETWKCIRVELKTDALNEKSRKAILRIGATEEGIFRRHMITETGRYRDSVYFSIIDSEWDDVKKDLLSKLSVGR